MKYMLFAIVLLIASSRAFALGVDVGPVHVHGTKVKVGNTIDLKIVPDSLTKDDEEKDRIRTMRAHRKGDDNDNYTIKVVWKDLDDDSKELLKKVETGNVYKMKIEKQDDDWKLLKIRKNDDD
jgi:hypothetical protein